VTLKRIQDKIPDLHLSDFDPKIVSRTLHQKTGLSGQIPDLRTPGYEHPLSTVPQSGSESVIGSVSGCESEPEFGSDSTRDSSPDGSASPDPVSMSRLQLRKVQVGV